MNPELPRIDRDKVVSPHVQEVEFALILSRMINSVKEDPSQMRLAIYEFARARLKLDAAWADQTERERLSAALETAIQGVEDFTVRRDDQPLLQAPAAFAPAVPGPAPAESASTSIVTIQPVTPAATDILAPNLVRLRPELWPAPEMQTRVHLSAPVSAFMVLCIGVMLFGALATAAIYILRSNAPAQVAMTAPPPIPPQPAAAEVKPPTVPFPLPTDYGIYALSGDDTLSELHPLSLQVPDKRVALSSPINEPSRTTLPDGKAKFVLFRRDLAGNAPDRIEIRVVARVVRALVFDGKGKASFVPVSDAWSIRNFSYVFRVRPIAGNPEMLLMQPENADFTLPAGRYVLALKEQGYEFTVAGDVTDPTQCLERTDAANGAFYSDCQNQKK